MTLEFVNAALAAITVLYGLLLLLVAMSPTELARTHPSYVPFETGFGCGLSGGALTIIGTIALILNDRNCMICLGYLWAGCALILAYRILRHGPTRRRWMVFFGDFWMAVFAIGLNV
ncbi:MAG: hypothetical protein AAFW64_05925 [Pseudomonadota bacterium]